MFHFISKLFSRPTKKIAKSNPNIDVEMAFRLHSMVSAINNSPREDKLKSLETLRQGGHITELEFQNAKRDLSV